MYEFVHTYIHTRRYVYIYVYICMPLHTLYTPEIRAVGHDSAKRAGRGALVRRLQVKICCSVLQCDAVCCSVLQCVAVCCSALQCVAVCCSVLQCVAVCCSDSV